MCYAVRFRRGFIISSAGQVQEDSEDEGISSFEASVTKQRHNVTFQETLKFTNTAVRTVNLATDNFAAN